MYLGHVKVLLGMFLSLKTLYRKRTVIWPFYFYTIIRTLSFCSISSYNYCTFFTKKLKEILVLLPIVRHFLKVKRSLSEDKYPKKDYTIFENQKRRELL